MTNRDPAFEDAIGNFEEKFSQRFPNHVLASYGGSLLDYIMGNVQTAVADEIILMLETWGQTMKEAQASPKLSNSTEERDWKVAEAHLLDLISEVRQYRTRGAHGHHSTHTGTITLPIPTQE